MSERGGTETRTNGGTVAAAPREPGQPEDVVSSSNPADTRFERAEPLDQASTASGSPSDASPSAPALKQRQPGNTLVDEDDIISALREVEARAATIPSLDEGKSPRARERDAAASSERDTPASVPAGDGAIEPNATRPTPAPRFKIPTKQGAASSPAGKSGAAPPAAQSASQSAAGAATKATATAATSAHSEGALPAIAAPRTALWKHVYRALDRVLWLVNLPFDWMPNGTRAVVGQVALATTVLSLLAAHILPALFPRRDALTFLAEKRAALDARSRGSDDKHAGGKKGAEGGHADSDDGEAHGDDGHGKSGAKDGHAKSSGKHAPDKSSGKGGHEKPSGKSDHGKGDKGGKGKKDDKSKAGHGKPSGGH